MNPAYASGEALTRALRKMDQPNRPINYIRWPHKNAVGSSYCFNQSPGGELYGGLTVTIRRPGSAKGAISFEPTDRRTGRSLGEGFARDIGKLAEEGVREAATMMGVNLDDYDVIISDIAYHPVDSPPSVYKGAAESAFRSAWQAWRRFYKSPADGRND